MDDRESFVMYRSFVDALEMLDYDEYGQAMRAINRYAIYGETPTDLPTRANIVFTMAKPQLDANIERRDNGKKGGRPKKENHRFLETETKTKPMVIQNATEEKPNVNVNVNENVNLYIHIRDMYNSTCVSFPKVTSLSEKRKKAISARLKVYTVDDFQRLFTKAEESDFLKGSNGRNWSATFDWLIADANMAKVLDGNYDNKKSAKVNPFNAIPANGYTADELEKLYAN